MTRTVGMIVLATALASATAFGQQDARALAAGLQDPAWEKRMEATQALARLGADGKPAAAALAVALGDATAMVRMGAAMALGSIGPPAVAAAPALREAVRTSDLSLTAVAGYALWSVAGDSAGAVGALRLALAGSDARARTLASAALVEMKGDARGARAELEAALADKDPAVRSNAACALTNVTGDVARLMPVVLAVAHDSAAPSFARVNAVRALGRMATSSDKVLPEIVAFLKDPEGDLRWAAAGTLEGMGSAAAAALPALKRIPEGDAAGIAARKAIAAIEAAAPKR